MTTETNELFEFEYKGKKHKFEKSFHEVTKPGFQRKNRHLSEGDLTWLLLESVAGDDTLAVIDDMTMPEFKAFAEDLTSGIQHYTGATLGE